MKATYDVVIIGAGLTGLTTALLLKQKGLSVLVVEKAGRAGGAINTLNKDGYIYESGPNTASLSNIETLMLFDMLQGKCALEIARKEANRRLILKNGKPRALPAGLAGGICTPLFTWADKFRLLGEPFRKAGADPDECVASLAKRRLGKSFLDYAVQPFIGGIYAGDPERLITRLALPKLYALEQDYGSFIKGAIKKSRIPKSALEKRVTKEVFSFKGGLVNLINALLESVGNENIVLNEKCRVVAEGDSWCVQLSSEKVHAAKVISTIGAHAVGEVFDFMPQSLCASMEKLRYAKVVQVAIGVRAGSNVDTRAFGLLIPSVEQRGLLGVLYPSACFEGRASNGNFLLSAFLGGINHPGIITQPDEEIRRLVAHELHEIYGLPANEIAFMDIFRHPHAIPQYEIACEQLWADISAFEQAYPGIILAGNLRGGIGIPNRIKQAFDISNQINHHGTAINGL